MRGSWWGMTEAAEGSEKRCHLRQQTTTPRLPGVWIRVTLRRGTSSSSSPVLRLFSSSSLPLPLISPPSSAATFYYSYSSVYSMHLFSCYFSFPFVTVSFLIPFFLVLLLFQFVYLFIPSFLLFLFVLVLCVLVLSLFMFSIFLLHSLPLHPLNPSASLYSPLPHHHRLPIIAVLIPAGGRALPPPAAPFVSQLSPRGLRS